VTTRRVSPRKGALAPAPEPGGRTPAQAKGAGVDQDLRADLAFGLDPFELFCAYHLGITPENTYRFQNVHDVAKRFGVSAAQVRQGLQAYGMDQDSAMDRAFNMTVAQVDIQVAPAGVDLKTVAQMHYEEYLAAPCRKRDWAKEIQDDAEENERTYGRR
jgi:transposase-like protein